MGSLLMNMRFTSYISLFSFVLIITDVRARHLTYNREDMPIKIIDTSFGQSKRERIDYIEAIIHPRHLSAGKRVHFATSGPLESYYQGIRAPRDVRGHLVAAQFSGPPEWYNLTPQNARVNRNQPHQSLTTDWYDAECEVQKFLQEDEDRHAHWIVRMRYVNDSERPDEYHLNVRFVQGTHTTGRTIDTQIRNPFESEDNTLWSCQGCGGNRDDDRGGCSRA